MIVPDYVAPIIALMAAAVVTLILVLPVAALVTIADRILALRVAALVNIADPFFKGLFFSRKDRTPDVDQDVARTGADALQGVPDYVAPIVGWRAWKWDPPQLTSINNQSAWYPGQPMKAKCAGGGLGDSNLSASWTRTSGQTLHLWHLRSEDSRSVVRDGVRPQWTLWRSLPLGQGC